jgi:hypothetical protein
MARKLYRVGRSRTGLGLFAMGTIEKGAFIVEYRGRRIANALAKRLESRGNRYMFELNRRWTVDGSSRRNVARYANHSCRPNAESDLVRGKVMLRAVKRIRPGEEITYDYGEEYFELFLRPVGCRCAKCLEKRTRKDRRRPAQQHGPVKRGRLCPLMAALFANTIAMLAIGWLAGLTALGQQATDTVTPPAASQSEKHLHNYSDFDKSCMRWTDRCRTCDRAIGGGPRCSNLGIACTPAEVECVERERDTEKK